MRTIIAGSRGIAEPAQIKAAVAACGWSITTVLSGAARGVDQLGELWAEQNAIPVERYPANWAVYGRGAGYRRNVEMADRAEALLALWDGESPGTKHTIDIAQRKGLKVFVWRV